MFSIDHKSVVHVYDYQICAPSTLFTARQQTVTYLKIATSTSKNKQEKKKPKIITIHIIWNEENLKSFLHEDKDVHFNHC